MRGDLFLKNTISGFIFILILVLIAVSGCISQTSSDENSADLTNSKLVGEFNFPKNPGNGGSPPSLYNVTIPEGAKSIKVEYQNMTPEVYTLGGQDATGFSQLTVYTLSVVPVDGKKQLDYYDKMIANDGIDPRNNTGMNGVMEFESSGVKGMLLSGVNIKGKVKIFITT